MDVKTQRRIRTIVETIESQTNITDSTKENYISRLTRLVRMEGIKPYLYKTTSNKRVFQVSKMKNIVEQINTISDKRNTLNAYYIALWKSWTITVGENNKYVKKLHNNYIRPINELNQTEPKTLNNNQEIILQNFEEGRNRFIKEIEDGKYKVNETELPLALLLFFDAVRRRDIIFSKITDDVVKTNKTDNWFFKNKGNWYIQFNQFKTVKKYGPQLFKINTPILQNILDRQLIFKKDRELYTRSLSSLNNDLEASTLKYFGAKGKINDLRIVDASNDFINPDKVKLLKKATQAGHSVRTRLTSYWRQKKDKSETDIEIK